MGSTSVGEGGAKNNMVPPGPASSIPCFIAVMLEGVTSS